MYVCMYVHFKLYVHSTLYIQLRTSYNNIDIFHVYSNMVNNIYIYMYEYIYTHEYT